MREKQQQGTYYAETEEIRTRQDRVVFKLVISQYDDIIANVEGAYSKAQK